MSDLKITEIRLVVLPQYFSDVSFFFSLNLKELEILHAYLWIFDSPEFLGASWQTFV